MATVDKNKGLSEQQRLAKTQAETEAKKKQQESQERFDENFPGFHEAYTDAVKHYGIKHVVALNFMPSLPDWVRQMIMSVIDVKIRPVECREELNTLARKELEAEMAGNGHIKE